MLITEYKRVIQRLENTTGQEREMKTEKNTGEKHRTVQNRKQVERGLRCLSVYLTAHRRAWQSEAL